MIHVKISRRQLKVLDFDLETLAAGYADPSWVPDKITAAAWSWNEGAAVEVKCDPRGYFDRDRRRRIIRPLLKAIDEAEVLQGHNLIRFDLRVLLAECMRLDLPLPEPKLVIDTMRIVKAKGFKKSQDDISVLCGIKLRKRSLNWQEWDDAYAESPPWPTVVERVTGDVRQHKQLRWEMARRGWLRPAVAWKP